MHGAPLLAVAEGSASEQAEAMFLYSKSFEKGRPEESDVKCLNGLELLLWWKLCERGKAHWDGLLCEQRGVARNGCIWDRNWVLKKCYCTVLQTLYLVH